MTIQYRIHENGGPCCTSPNLEWRCAKCKEFAALAADDVPNAYDAVLKAASASPLSDGFDTFEAAYKAMRLLTLAEERAEMDAAIEASPSPRMTAAEEAESTPVDIYAAGIKVLKENLR